MGYHLGRLILLVSILSSILSAPASGIDYNAEWTFTVPIGDVEPESWFGHELLIYDARTGNLNYNTGGDVYWSPPDLASPSGAFITGATLPDVPLVYETPHFQRDLVIGGETVIGSNGIRIGFEPYFLWPYVISDEFVLAQWGLDSVPSTYDYGRVLPPRLTEEFLLNDLHAAFFPDSSFVELAYVVPEPSSVFLGVGAALLGFMLLRRRHIGNFMSVEALTS